MIGTERRPGPAGSYGCGNRRPASRSDGRKTSPGLLIFKPSAHAATNLSRYFREPARRSTKRRRFSPPWRLWPASKVDSKACSIFRSPEGACAAVSASRSPSHSFLPATATAPAASGVRAPPRRFQAASSRAPSGSRRAKTSSVPTSRQTASRSSSAPPAALRSGAGIRTIRK
jgi:hypothetical protein